MNELQFALLGQRLQTIMRRSRNPIAQRRATVLLEYMIGTDINYLAQYYAIPIDYLNRLIEAFERKGIDAVHEGTRTKATRMSPEECSLIVEMGRLTPRAFGIARDTWLLSQLRDHALAQNCLRVVDLEGIRQALRKANLPFEDDERT